MGSHSSPLCYTKDKMLPHICVIMYASKEKTMAQRFPRFCPRCGAPNVAQQPVCATCGLDLTYRAAQPEQRAHIAQNAPPQTPTISPSLPSPTQGLVYQTQNYEQPL